MNKLIIGAFFIGSLYICSVYNCNSRFAGAFEIGNVAPTMVIEFTVQDSLYIKEHSFDFGIIDKGQPVKHNFWLYNKGENSFKITDITPACGCTTPYYEKGLELKPNDSKKITIAFNGNASGSFHKAVYIAYGSGKIKEITLLGEALERQGPPKVLLDCLVKRIPNM